MGKPGHPLAGPTVHGVIGQPAVRILRHKSCDCECVESSAVKWAPPGAPGAWKTQGAPAHSHNRDLATLPTAAQSPESKLALLTAVQQSESLASPMGSLRSTGRRGVPSCGSRPDVQHHRRRSSGEALRLASCYPESVCLRRRRNHGEARRPASSSTSHPMRQSFFV